MTTVEENPNPNPGYERMSPEEDFRRTSVMCCAKMQPLCGALKEEHTRLTDAIEALNVQRNAVETLMKYYETPLSVTETKL